MSNPNEQPKWATQILITSNMNKCENVCARSLATDKMTAWFELLVHWKKTIRRSNPNFFKWPWAHGPVLEWGNSGALTHGSESWHGEQGGRVYWRLGSAWHRGTWFRSSGQRQLSAAIFPAWRRKPQQWKFYEWDTIPQLHWLVWWTWPHHLVWWIVPPVCVASEKDENEDSTLWMTAPRKAKFQFRTPFTFVWLSLVRQMQVKENKRTVHQFLSSVDGPFPSGRNTNRLRLLFCNLPALLSLGTVSLPRLFIRTRHLQNFRLVDSSQRTNFSSSAVGSHCHGLMDRTITLCLMSSADVEVCSYACS